MKYSYGTAFPSVHRLGLALWGRPLLCPSQGRMAHPFLGGLGDDPPLISVSICLSPPGPTRWWVLSGNFFTFFLTLTYLTNLFICMITPAQQSWNKNGPMAYF